jgi:hypothetical protein
MLGVKNHQESNESQSVVISAHQQRYFLLGLCILQFFWIRFGRESMFRAKTEDFDKWTWLNKNLIQILIVKSLTSGSHSIKKKSVAK